MITRQGQDVYDITLQTCGQLDSGPGSVSNLFAMILANPFLKLDSNPAPGLTININNGNVVNQNVVNYLTLNKFVPNNGGTPNPGGLENEDGVSLENENGQILLPEPPPVGGVGLQNENGEILQNENGENLLG